MAHLSVTRTAPADVPLPLAGRASFFIDLDGTPKVKLDNGSIAALDMWTPIAANSLGTHPAFPDLGSFALWAIPKLALL